MYGVIACESSGTFFYALQGLQIVNLFIILVMFKKTEQMIFTERTKKYPKLFGKCVIFLYNIYVSKTEQWCIRRIG